MSIKAGLSTASFVVAKNPLLSWILMEITNRIHFDNWRGDVLGFLTAAIVSLPLALAFGVASGAGAIGASLTAKNPELGLPADLTLSKVLPATGLLKG
ncbi:MAG: sulfate permease [Microcystis sp. M54BS1]|uniref:sulfate permease n=1 Tax=unclassified Microcystis TaxID=2643300 RepID=UPI00187E673D|nr:sulfate permease [Microcystis sp. LEGE 08355]MCA2508684.1 sulfate permease [Microcystis sp. M62BS1]MCA2511565.1 sulfate permease [Microcystis sp. M60BS1]MCA2516425.1 sulfate permease [Microcystis sp. M59BS1]MCA2522403.1 sulfate permease [Microcystis sp. M63BS1]MCA2525886.1 sulfate permease [Microcystis sp. M61BS1]MCA2532586.1 sulfate permease [Microcystis sp. M51BS1]MCA2533929.1 sulfate permease [Microcystis sp. M57BS1]MCA2538784.1 sulfate permease [Microcystis sp. M54BS1]MCA2545026.1 s